MYWIKDHVFIVILLVLNAAFVSADAAEPTKKPIKPTPPTVNQTQIQTPQIKNPAALSIAEKNALRKQLNSHAIEYRDYMDKLKDYRAKARDMELIRKPNTARARTTLRSQNTQWNGQYDCNDMDASVKPGQAEVCDGIDNDCDGDVDEGVTANLFLDADGDGWGDSSKPIKACHIEDGYASRGNDCEDRNIQIYPGAADVEGDGIDANCDGNDG